MESATSIQPITGSQFLSVCNYITSFGVFLENLGLINSDERNQTVPVLNALFKYLNKFENQSEPKIQLLQKLFNEAVDSHIGDNETVIDIKIADKHYRYVINTALFSHYGYITGYLAQIIDKRENITSLILKQKMIQHLLDNYINNDQCSLPKGSSKLTLLAAERIFTDYILPIFNVKWSAGRNLSERQKVDFRQFKRFKRNPPADSDDDDNRHVIDESRKNLKNVSSGSAGSDTSEIVPVYSEEFEEGRNWNERKNEQTRSENIEDNVITIEDSDEDVTFVSDIHQGLSNYQFNYAPGNVSDTRNIPRVTESGKIESEVQHLSDDNPSSSRQAFKTTKGNEDLNKTERMKAIEKAANFMSSSDCKPRKEDFFKSVRILKHYILKLKHQDSDTFAVPTYDELAKEYCENDLNVPLSYESWYFFHSKHVEDVLFDTKFYFSENVDLFFKKYSLVNKVPRKVRVALTMYKFNLQVLQRTIRFEDFYYIWNRLMLNNFIPNRVHDLQTRLISLAIHRLALRQCNEERVNRDPITLYKTKVFNFDDFANFTSGLKLNETSITFKAFERFSLFSKVEVDNNRTYNNDSTKLILYEIELEKPVCGVIDLDRIIPMEKGSHIFLFDMDMLLNDVRIGTFGKVNLVFTLKLKTNICKEMTMVKIARAISSKRLPTIKKVYMDEN